MDIVLWSGLAIAICGLAACGSLVIALYRVPFARTRAGGLRALGSAFAFAAMGGLAFVVFRAAERREAETGTASLPSLSSLGANVTMSEYQRVQPGMSVDEVNRIIGINGIETARSEAGGFAVVIYVWKNSNGSNMMASFSQGKLTTKAQSNLP